MEKLLTELRLKADNCDNTKEGRARKGAYVDCIVMIKQVKNCTIPDVSVSLPDQYPDNEADGYVFRGKCGKMK
jgi:hypothetical protein